MRRARSVRTRADGNQKTVRDDHALNQKKYPVSSKTDLSEKAAKLAVPKQSKDGVESVPKRRTAVQRTPCDSQKPPSEDVGPSEEQVAANGTREKHSATSLDKKNGIRISKGNLPAVSEMGAAPSPPVRKKRTATVKAVVSKDLPVPGNKRKRGQATSGLASLAEKLKNAKSEKSSEKSDQQAEEVPEVVKIPKLRIMLSQKEIREDFMKISGRRPPSKPKRHSVQLWGLALCANLDLCTSRIY